jgi:hypothetical protein
MYILVVSFRIPFFFLCSFLYISYFINVSIFWNSKGFFYFWAGGGEVVFQFNQYPILFFGFTCPTTVSISQSFQSPLLQSTFQMDEPREEASTSATHTGDELVVPPEPTSTASESIETNFERERSPFSYDSSQLRRRHASAATQPDPTSSKENEEAVKRRPSADHSAGGGFYECNIW